MKLPALILPLRKNSLLVIGKFIRWHYCHVQFLTRNLTSCAGNSYLARSPINVIWTKHCFYSTTDSSSEISDLAKSILQTNFTEQRYNEMVKILKFFLSHGYSIEDIKKCSSYLELNDSSFDKLKQIAELDSNFIFLMPFMSLSTTSLRRAAQQARIDKLEIKGFLNRISYLSHHLETSVEDLIPALTKHSALLTTKFSKLHSKMVIFKEAEISTGDLVKDLWIFNYNEKLLTDRISAARDANVKLKPWMLRCSKKFFVSIVTKYSEKERILKGDDMHSYLAKKLDCSVEYVHLLMEKNSQLKTINIPKIDMILKFLLDTGYTAQEIRVFPRVFCAKIGTLKERLELYSHIRTTLPSLPQLCVSSSKLKSTLTKRNI